MEGDETLFSFSYTEVHNGIPHSSTAQLVSLEGTDILMMLADGTNLYRIEHPHPGHTLLNEQGNRYVYLEGNAVHMVDGFGMATFINSTGYSRDQTYAVKISDATISIPPMVGVISENSASDL